MMREIAYAVAGALTGPIGGAIAGYLYAREENQLARMQGLPEPKSTTTSTVIGMLAGCVIGLGGAYYGSQFAKAEMRTEAFIRTGTTPQPARKPIERAFDQTEHSLGAATHWQDKVTTPKPDPSPHR